MGFNPVPHFPRASRTYRKRRIIVLGTIGNSIPGDLFLKNRYLNLSHTPLMLNWAITFLIIALIAAVLGFGGLAGTAIGIAKILFVVFLILFIISFVMHRRTPRL